MNDSYEVNNWAKLSPAFRLLHNRRRVANGYSPLPEPKIDQYTGQRGLSDADRRRFNIPAVLDINELPAGVRPPPLTAGEGVDGKPLTRMRR